MEIFIILRDLLSSVFIIEELLCILYIVSCYFLDRHCCLQAKRKGKENEKKNIRSKIRKALNHSLGTFSCTHTVGIAAVTARSSVMFAGGGGEEIILFHLLKNLE